MTRISLFMAPLTRVALVALVVMGALGGAVVTGAAPLSHAAAPHAATRSTAVAAARASAAPCAGWSLVDDFRITPQQANPSPDRCGNGAVWSYMQSATLAYETSTYTTTGMIFSDSRNGIAGLEGWAGSYDDAGKGGLPAMVFNSTRQTQHPLTVTFPPHVVSVHPAPNRLAVIGWRSPISGEVAITGGVTDLDATCGNGIAWAIQQNAATLARGVIPNGGAQSVQTGALGDLTHVPVTAGDFLYFVVDPNGDYTCDSTGVSFQITPVSTSSSACATAPTAGLVNLWSGDGSTVDSVTGRSGTIQGAVTYVAGKGGRAFSFDGNGAAVLSAPAPAINQLPLTIAAWVRPALRTDGTDFPTNAVSDDQPFHAGHGFGVNVFPGGSQLKIEDHGTDTFHVVPGVSFVANRWYHVAVAYTPGRATIYVDGRLVDRDTYGQGALTGVNFVRIGEHNDDAGTYGTRRFFKGAIDDVRLYARALSADEVAHLYQGTAGSCATPSATHTSPTRHLLSDGEAAAPIYSGQNGKCLDVVGGAYTPGVLLETWDCTDRPSQRFSLDSQGRLHTLGACVSVLPPTGRGPSPIGLEPCASKNYDNEHWHLNAYGQVAVDYTTGGSGCLDLEGGNDANGARLIIWGCSADANQKWRLGTQHPGVVPQPAPVYATLSAPALGRPSGPTYLLAAADNTHEGVNRCLDTQSRTPGSPLVAFDCEGVDSQQFRINADGTINLFSNQLCLDGREGSGHPVIFDRCDGAATQRWYLGTLPGLPQTMNNNDEARQGGQIQNQGNNLCLDIWNGDTAQNAPVSMYQCQVPTHWYQPRPWNQMFAAGQMEATGEVLILQRTQTPPVVGHTAWAIKLADGTWLAGAWDGITPIWPPGFIPKGSGNGHWKLVFRSKQEVLDWFSNQPVQSQGGQSMGYATYNWYKDIVVPHANIPAALAMEAQSWGWGYGVLGNNCLDVSYKVLTAYGAHLPWPSATVVPNLWFNLVAAPQHPLLASQPITLGH